MFDMRRRQFTSLLGAAAAWPFAAHAQQPAVKIPRGVTQIGVLWPVDDDQVLAAFRQALRELGYIEGQNIAYEYRSSRGDDALLPALASELVRLDVDLILTWGVTAGRVAKETTTSIPIVNGSMSDPVRAKLIDSLARPGGNLTGLTSASPDVSAKRLQLMKELVPALARAAVHSINSLARIRMPGGTSRPNARAVFILRTKSNATGCSTGSSPDFSPLKTLST